MTTIHFYEKPGCANNNKQKQLLIAAGYQLIVHDLLSEPWAAQADKLRSFFAGMPVSDWFNRAAPAVKSGLLAPESFDEQQAIARMIEDPLLIRRPLLEVGETRVAGFDIDRINALFGLTLPEGGLESCPKKPHQEACRP